MPIPEVWPKNQLFSAVTNPVQAPFTISCSSFTDLRCSQSPLSNFNVQLRGKVRFDSGEVQTSFQSANRVNGSTSVFSSPIRTVAYLQTSEDSGQS